MKNKRINIGGMTYNVDPTNGLPVCSVIIRDFDLDYDGDCFRFAIPEGYELYDFCRQDARLIDTEDRLKGYESIYTVWFGTLEQIAALTPGCRFIPAKAV